MKCNGDHDSRTCKKTPDTPTKGANCKGAHPANYSKCPALTNYLIKKSTGYHRSPVTTKTPKEPLQTLLPPVKPNQPIQPSLTRQKSYAQAVADNTNSMQLLNTNHVLNQILPQNSKAIAADSNSPTLFGERLQSLRR